MTQLSGYPVHSDIKAVLLQYLADNGPSRPRDVYEPLADHFGLSAAKRSAMRDTANVPVWANKVAWARQGLKNDGYLAPKLGIWELSDAGKAAVGQPR